MNNPVKSPVLNRFFTKEGSKCVEPRSDNSGDSQYNFSSKIIQAESLN